MPERFHRSGLIKRFLNAALRNAIQSYQRTVVHVGQNGIGVVVVVVTVSVSLWMACRRPHSLCEATPLDAGADDPAVRPRHKALVEPVVPPDTDTTEIVSTLGANP